MDTELLLERIGPYVSNLLDIKHLLEEIQPMPADQALAHIDTLIPQSTGTWLTDLNILRNAIEEFEA